MKNKNVFYFRSNQTYLVWKSDDNAILRPAKIWIRPVKENGIEFEPDSKSTLILQATEVMDLLVVEGPSIVWIEEFQYYYMFFSASGYDNPYYHVSVARSKNVGGDRCF